MNTAGVKKYGLLISLLVLSVATAFFVFWWQAPVQKAERLMTNAFASGVPALQDVRSVHVYAHHHGNKVGEGFARGKDWREMMQRAIEKAVVDDTNQLVICFGYDYKKVPTPLTGPGQLRSAKGVIGIELKWKKKTMNYCGTKALATNRSAWQMLTAFSDNLKLPFRTLNSSTLNIRQYQTRQFFLNLNSGRVEEMYRGNKIVDIADVNQGQVKDMTVRLADWLLNNVDESSGRMQYKYWPSSGEFSKANNMIRQFMATYALQLWAQREGSEHAKALAAKNLAHNMAAFYQEEKGVGFIDESGKRKLGAAALAALALYVSPQSAEFQHQYKKLRDAILLQWQDTGEFRTFIRQLRNDQQNFYPGEALFYWAQVIAKENDASLQEKFFKSVSYYMNWHREQRNPAFVPWHTQAYFIVWRDTQDSRLKDAIFEMNDWLVSQLQDVEAQQGYTFPDMVGRFYYPAGGYGPPHASSNGVYLEGLIDAFQLAKEVGDTARQERYRKAIILGLRHSMQLEFQDELDMFYVSKRDKVLGGLRTTEYDNTIRVDNVQHNLLALFKILDRFEASDFNFERL